MSDSIQCRNILGLPHLHTFMNVFILGKEPGRYTDHRLPDGVPTEPLVGGECTTRGHRAPGRATHHWGSHWSEASIATHLWPGADDGTILGEKRTFNNKLSFDK